jgi:hypothetical protein
MTGPHKIFIYVYLYQANGTITFGNDTYTVLKDNVKFSIKITNWEWRGAGNKLRADLALGLNDQQYEPTGITPKPSDPDAQKTMALSSAGTVDVVNTAICDDVLVDVEVATYGMGGRAGVSITFPYFASTLEYDPTVSVSDDTTTSSGDTSASSSTSSSMTSSTGSMDTSSTTSSTSTGSSSTSSGGSSSGAASLSPIAALLSLSAIAVAFIAKLL